MNFLVAIILYEKQAIKGSALQYCELYLAAHIFFNLKDTNALLGSFYVTKTTSVTG